MLRLKFVYAEFFSMYGENFFVYAEKADPSR